MATLNIATFASASSLVGSVALAPDTIRLGDIEDRWVLIEATDGRRLHDEQPGLFAIRAVGGGLRPTFSVVPVGSSVELGNSMDRPVTLLFGDARVGPLRTGQRARIPLERAGETLCALADDPAQRSVIVVSDGRLCSLDERGEFEIQEIEAGRYLVRVWIMGQWRVSQHIEIATEQTACVQLSVRLDAPAPTPRAPR